LSTSALRTLIQTGAAEVLPLDRIVREAKAELEAIEKACAVLYQYGVVHNEYGDEHETTPTLAAAADHLMKIGEEQEP
jgi:hypothetical protein